MENQQEPQGAEQLTEPQATEPTAEPSKQEPHGEPAQAQQIDWKAEARKWEKRAKESNAKLQGSSDLEDRLAAVEERAQKAEKEAADLKRKSDMLEVAAGDLLNESVENRLCTGRYTAGGHSDKDTGNILVILADIHCGFCLISYCVKFGK